MPMGAHRPGAPTTQVYALTLVGLCPYTIEVYALTLYGSMCIDFMGAGDLFANTLLTRGRGYGTMRAVSGHGVVKRYGYGSEGTRR